MFSVATTDKRLMWASFPPEGPVLSTTIKLYRTENAMAFFY